jgi:peptide/nickel transport system ATP-binding protein
MIPTERALVTITDLTVCFDGWQVLHGVDFSIRRGEALGLVGESGSGKSVTWLAALGLLPGKAEVRGSVTLDHVRGGRIGMIFQDPTTALNPVLTIGRQLSEALALHRDLSGASNKAEAKRLMELVGIPDATQRLGAYPHEFSGGQNQRVMIAMALAGEPDLLVADEPTTSLDVTIQAQILEIFKDIRREMNMALVLISHDLGVIAETCDRVAVMYAGRIVEEASADQLFANPRHPYTQGLLASLPALAGPKRRLQSIPGTVPDPKRLPPGCAFAPRCSHAVVQCASAVPRLFAKDGGRKLACHPIWRQRNRLRFMRLRQHERATGRGTRDCPNLPCEARCFR